MKSFYRILFFSLFLLCVKSSLAQTVVSDTTAAGTWTLQGSPYQIMNDLWVLDDSTLTIEPGVTVEFQGDYRFRVSGSLNAVGTESDSITFNAVQGSTWHGIILNNSNVPNPNYTQTTAIVWGDNGAMNDNDSTIFEYCRFFNSSKPSSNTNNDNYRDKSGGAVYISKFDKTRVSHCRFEHNNAIYGGALAFKDCHVLVYNNTFKHNGDTLSAEPCWTGGALWISAEDKNAVIKHNIFEYNKANSYGGFWVGYSTVDFHDNQIRYNTTTGGGGGGGFSNCKEDGSVTHNVFEYNNAGDGKVGHLGDGGGMYTYSSPIKFSYNTFMFNTATHNGGGVFAGYTNVGFNTCGAFRPINPKFDNCLIANNTSGTNGGGMYYSSFQNLYIANSTFVNNYTEGKGGGVCAYLTDCNLTNCIVYGNKASDKDELYYYQNAYSTYSSCGYGKSKIYLTNLITSSVDEMFYLSSYGVSNYNQLYRFVCKYADPLFLNATDTAGALATCSNGLEPNYRFGLNSPCIDYSSSSPGSIGEVDLDGNPRKVACEYDCGAYEQQLPKGGVISSDETWGEDTVYVQCEMIINDDVTLTILPGTVVKLQEEAVIWVYGTLIAQGTTSDSIVFLFDRDDAKEQTLIFQDDANSTNTLDNDTSIIQYCKFKNQYDVRQIVSVSGFGTVNGGAIKASNYNKLKIINSRFDYVAAGKGGAISLTNSDPLIQGNTFYRCRASSGAGIYLDNGAAPLIKDNLFADLMFNSAGGIFAYQSVLNVESNIFDGIQDTAMLRSYAGIYSSYSEGTIRNNHFTNLQANFGSAIYMSRSVLNISNNLFANNYAKGNAGLYMSNGCDGSKIIGNTFANNKALTHEGVIRIYGEVLISHNIFKGNTSEQSSMAEETYGNVGTMFISTSYGIPTIEYNLFDDTTGVKNLSGVNLLVGDANFTNPTVHAGCTESTANANAPDYSLMGSSDAIDAGKSDTTGFGMLPFDLAGNDRVKYGKMDFGCYEYSCHDQYDPVALAKDTSLYLNINGIAAVSANELDDGSSDDCGISEIKLSLVGDQNQQNVDQLNFNGNHLGIQTVVFTATDLSGNTNSQNSTVTILDTLAPEVNCMDADFALDANGEFTLDASMLIANSTDNCGIVSSLISLQGDASLQNQESITFNCSNIGSNIIIVTVEDASGNSSSCSSTVNIADDSNPVAVFAGSDFYLDANGQLTINAAHVGNNSTDNCSVELFELSIIGEPGLQNQSSLSFDCTKTGSYNITLSVEDASGNAHAANTTITISDTISPVLISQDVSIYLDANGAATITVGDIDNGSTDNCNLATLTISQSVFDCNMVGANNVTLYGEDDYGNNTSKVAVVTVLDTISPTVVAQNQTLHLDANGAATLQLSDVENGSSDNCAIASSKLSVVGDASRQNMSELLFICDDLEGNTITYTVVDVNGNASSVNVNVLIEDTIEPTALAQNVTIYLNTAGEATLTAMDVNNGSSDNCSITEYLLSKTDYNCADLGIENVQLKVTDQAGNSDSILAQLTILDTISPVLMPADISVYLDANGTAQITVTDVDNGSYDNCTLTTLSIDNGNFDCAMLGANTITLTGIDNSNNTTTASLNVQVLDTIKPVIVCPSDIEIWTCDEQYSVQSESAEVTEICSYNLINNYNQSANASDSYPLGEHSVLWTVTDAAANEASCAQQINVYQYPLPTAGFVNSTPICEGGAVQLNGLQDLIACTTDCELPNYAASYSNLSHLVYIKKVVIDGNEKTSLGTNHSAYTQEPTCTLSADSVVELSISVSNYHSFNYYVSVFIDWNRDGDFEDMSEVQTLDVQNTVGAQSLVVHVPATAVPGKTMLRVVAQMNHQPTASGNYPVGETEDYMLELVQWDNQSIVDYQWEGPNDWSASGIQSSITNLSTVNSGVYKLTVTTFNGCVDTWEKELTVQNPEITFTADTIVSMCTDTIVLQPGSFDTYMWNNGSQASECQVGNYGTYSVTVSAEGCVAADTVVISECQDILLQSGWNLFSTYINTDDEMSMLLSEIENAISVIKDGDGGIYWPAFNVNSIGNHVKGAGYYGKLSSDVNLRIKGTAVNPLNHVINLVPGYNIVGFLRKYEAPVDVVFENVEPNLLFVKDQTGKIYWPAFNINQVGDLCPGYGYYVLMLNADQLSYPDNASMFNKSMVAAAEPQLLKTTLLTNTSMTMAIPLNAWMKQPQLNDEIGVYSAQGNLLGAGVFEGKDMAITIWGADEYDSNSKGSQTGARLIIKLQSAMDHSIHELKVEEWQHGNSTFKNEDYAIVGKIATGASQVESGITAYPNPFVNEIRFVYSLQTAGDVVIEVYDLYGKLLLSELKANQQMGSHDYCLNGTSLARGVYQLVLSTKEGSKTVRIEKI